MKDSAHFTTIPNAELRDPQVKDLIMLSSLYPHVSSPNQLKATNHIVSDSQSTRLHTELGNLDASSPESPVLVYSGLPQGFAWGGLLGRMAIYWRYVHSVPQERST